MTCDDAFDRMTMPGAGEDKVLAGHLRRCARCRAMQDTLSPAIEWLSPARDDSSTSEFLQPLLLTEEAVRIAERAARGLTRPGLGKVKTRRRQSTTGWIAWGGVAATLIYMAVFLPGRRDSTVGPEHPPAIAVLADECLWKMPVARAQTGLIAQQVVASCVTCHAGLSQ